ncbi:MULTISPECIES: hypothetical protein [Stenotrophomonas]|uniref:hypothetical protein n=1 Tax=Stenotrophomonas TaxID=40323 RepID=UPI00131F07A4|nr:MULTISPECIES: hypothetical protein [Stenotrophomonas]
MKHWTMAALWVGAVLLVGCKPEPEGQVAPGKARASVRLKPADQPSFKDGVLSFCGEVMPLVQRGAAPSDIRGLKLSLGPSAERDVGVRLLLASLDPFYASCLDPVAESPIKIYLRCDPPPAPIWEDFSKREWLSRTERPAEGLIVLRGDPTLRMNYGFHFMAAPSQAYRPGEFPFQGKCDSEPGAYGASRSCVVRYRKGRVGVEYTYLARSIKPWREVDDLVRTTLEGRPSTALCPSPGSG